MFMSRIKPNTEKMSASQLFRIIGESPYTVHQNLWHFFKNSQKTHRDFIYRIEYLSQGPTYMVVSGTAPSELPESWSVETKEYQPSLREGMQLDFILRANPARTRKSGPDGKCVRHDVVMDARTSLKLSECQDEEEITKSQVVQQECFKWLDQRSQSNGFELRESTVIVDSYVQHKFFKSGHKKPIQFSTVDFRGKLMVTDTDLFRSTLYKGIGPAKSFGCGLLMVRKCL